MILVKAGTELTPGDEEDYSEEDDSEEDDSEEDDSEEDDSEEDDLEDDDEDTLYSVLAQMQKTGALLLESIGCQERTAGYDDPIEYLTPM